MKYKIGDRVRVREDLVERYDRSPAVSDEMAKMRGKTLTIRKVVVGIELYQVRENDWKWSDDMLEPFTEGRFPFIESITESLGLKEGDRILVNGAEYLVGIFGLINKKGDYANPKSVLGQSFKIIPKPRTGAEILAHLKELRGDWEPDWKDQKTKHFPTYSHFGKGWMLDVWTGREVVGTLFFSKETSEKAKEYLNTLTREESMNLLKEMRI